jgi:hypothetical protein
MTTSFTFAANISSERITAPLVQIDCTETPPLDRTSHFDINRPTSPIIPSNYWQHISTE